MKGRGEYDTHKQCNDFMKAGGWRGEEKRLTKFLLPQFEDRTYSFTRQSSQQT